MRLMAPIVRTPRRRTPRVRPRSRIGAATRATASYDPGVANQWHFEPDTYLAMVRSEIPAYDELQRTLADATRPVPAARILDLGSGTGVTARAVLDVHPLATLVGV